MVGLGTRLLRAVIRRTMPGAPLGDAARPPVRRREIAGPGGRRIPVEEQGHGPTIVLVHGGSGDLMAWAGVADRLATRWRVVRFTRPLYRGETPESGSAAMSAEVADLRAVVAAFAAPLVVLPAVRATVVLPGQGHGANLRAPDAVARVISSFAARVLPSSTVE